jgi:hypothetical protein
MCYYLLNYTKIDKKALKEDGMLFLSLCDTDPITKIIEVKEGKNARN